MQLHSIQEPQHFAPTKLSKRERRNLAKQEKVKTSILEPRLIRPLTINQKNIFINYDDNNLLLMGTAGTGKTFLSTYLAIKDVLQGKYDRLIIFRSAVSSRNIGFLPGSEKEKMKVFEAPYSQICADLFERKDAYAILKEKGFIEFESTSFLRGLTFDNSIILIDEVQNLNWQEIKTVLTRVGKNCKVLICGDTAQPDLLENNGKGDVIKLLRVAEQMDIKPIYMTIQDIVRGPFVKSFITSCENLGYY